MDAEGFAAAARSAEALFPPLEAYLVGRGLKMIG
jgi:hypothetical protein